MVSTIMGWHLNYFKELPGLRAFLLDPRGLQVLWLLPQSKNMDTRVILKSKL